MNINDTNMSQINSSMNIAVFPITAVIRDSTREVLFSAFGCTNVNCTGEESGGKIYQYEHTYGMSRG